MMRMSGAADFYLVSHSLCSMVAHGAAQSASDTNSARMMLLAPLTGSTLLEPKDAGDDVGKVVLKVGMLCDLAVHRAEDFDRTAAMHPPLPVVGHELPNGDVIRSSLSFRHNVAPPRRQNGPVSDI